MMKLTNSDKFKIINGLTGEPKRLPTINTHNPNGVNLFQSMVDAPNYYQNKCEQYILENRDLKSMLGNDIEKMILVNLFPHPNLHFETLVEAACQMSANTTNSVDNIVEQLSADNRLPVCITFLSNAIGELDQQDSDQLLSKLSDHLCESDRLLLAVDLRKSPEVINLAYTDEHGICSQYAKHTLSILNEQIGADFNIDKFQYNASYDPEMGILSKYLTSTAAQKIKLTDYPRPIILSKWETIRIGQSKKYSHQEVNMLLTKCGLTTLDYVTDDKSWFAMYVVEKAQW